MTQIIDVMMVVMIMMLMIKIIVRITLTSQAGGLGIFWRASLKREQSAAPLDVKTTFGSKVVQNCLKSTETCDNAQWVSEKKNLSTVWLFIH